MQNDNHIERLMQQLDRVARQVMHSDGRARESAGMRDGSQATAGEVFEGDDRLADSRPVRRAQCRELIELIEAERSRQLMPDPRVAERLDWYRHHQMAD